MRGHLTKRSKNSWTIVLSLGRDPATGKKRQQWVSITGTKKDAEQKLTELLHQLNTGGFVKPSKLTLAGFLAKWQRDYVDTNVRPRTAEGYRQIVENHLSPELGNIPLAQLQPSHIQEYFARMLGHGRVDGKAGGLSARTVLHHHRTLSEALSHAIKWGLIARNPCDAVDPPRPGKRQMQTLDAEGVRILLEVARPTPFYPIFHLAIYTGLRRSELMALRWKHVDLTLATISVVQTLHRLRSGELVFQEPKTAKSRRLIALTPTSALMLRQHREQQELQRETLSMPFREDDLVFAQFDGSPINPDLVSQAWRRTAKAAGYQGVRLHDARHTHATLMLKQGVHPKIVSERLGHATVATTLDIYSHVTPSMQEAAALRFDEALSPEAVSEAKNEATHTVG